MFNKYSFPKLYNHQFSYSKYYKLLKKLLHRIYPESHKEQIVSVYNLQFINFYIHAFDAINYKFLQTINPFLQNLH